MYVPDILVVLAMLIHNGLGGFISQNSSIGTLAGALFKREHFKKDSTLVVVFEAVACLF